MTDNNDEIHVNISQTELNTINDIKNAISSYSGVNMYTERFLNMVLKSIPQVLEGGQFSLDVKASYIDEVQKRISAMFTIYHIPLQVFKHDTRPGLLCVTRNTESD